MYKRQQTSNVKATYTVKVYVDADGDMVIVQNPTLAPAIEKSDYEPKTPEADASVDADTVNDATILLILSIMLPLILKFGGEKGRIAIIGVMGLIFVIGLLLIKTTEYLGIDLYDLINKLPKFEPLVYIILFLLFSVVILGISYLISLTILKKKEF